VEHHAGILPPAELSRMKKPKPKEVTELRERWSVGCNNSNNKPDATTAAIATWTTL